MEAALMKARRTKVSAVYNGVKLTVPLDDYAGSFEYEDPETGSSDSITTTFRAGFSDWLGPWAPKFGDKLKFSIISGESVLDCGDFTVDEFSFDGPPFELRLSALSIPADQDFRETTRTQTWEEVTLYELANTIAGRYGLGIVYDADEVTIATAEQNDQKDSDFLSALCKSVGLSFKVCMGNFVIFDRTRMMAKAAAAKITKEKVSSVSFTSSMLETYTGGTMAYTDSTTDEEISVTVGTEGRLLQVTGYASSAADAEAQITAAVNEANHDMTKLTLTLAGNPGLVSASCVDVSGLGCADGKYYIDKAIHKVDAYGYTTKLEMSRVNE